jgi:polar amino acid transport system substrate-binding protein
MKSKTTLFVSMLVLISILLASCTATSDKVRVATEAAYPPFETVNEQTKALEGFDIDLMNAIAKKAGFEVEFVNTPFDSVLAGIATCQFDAAISAITITEERAKEYNFSTPYVTAGQIITVRIDNTDIVRPEDLAGKTVGVQLSTTGQIEVEKIAGAAIKPYDTVDLAFLDLVNGQVDAVVADLAPSINYINQSKDKIRQTGDVFTTENYGVAICKTNTELLEKINAALADLEADGTLKSLQDQWLSGK